MTDFEDYTAVFVQECDELLDDLEERLGVLSDGSGDPEVVNAAFRAVHSIKGGADAFGYRELIAFAHVFEATMDAIRSDRVAATPVVCEVLIRGRDVLCDLVERARVGDTTPLPAAEAMIDELSAVSGGEPTAVKAPAAEAPQPDQKSAPEPVPEPALESAQEPTPAPAQNAAAPDEALDLVEERAYRIHFAPGPDFQTSGHDPLRLIQALRGLGALQVQVEGEIPPLADLDPDLCPLSWEIDLETDSAADAINHFFDIYRSTAEIGITAIEDEDELPELPAGISDAAATSPPATGTSGAAEPAQAAASQTALEPVKAPATAAPATTAPATTTPASSTAALNKAPRTLRVDFERVDRLVNMVGEIVITQAAMAQTLADQGVADIELGHATDAMTRQIRELQESVMAIRAQPVKAVFSRMARLVRDLAQQLGKEVRAEILGEHTEVDTTLIEELAEPLIHMVRNAMDHGLEAPDDRVEAGKPRQGTISISAEHRGERVLIGIADDGRGIDRDRVLAKAIERGLVEPGTPLAPEEIDQLVFHPGLTTVDTASNVSGRGVGMDVVKRNISALGGRVHLENRPGEGTSITITLPLSLAVLDGMTIAVGDQRYVIPLGAVVESLTLGDATPRRLPSGTQVMVRRDEYLPLLSVRNALGIAGSRDTEQMVVIVDTDADSRMGLMVDELIGQRQVVLKSLESNYRGVQGISGATILSDGRAALILDVPALHQIVTSGAPSTLVPSIITDRTGPDTAKTEYVQ